MSFHDAITDNDGAYNGQRNAGDEREDFRGRETGLRGSRASARHNCGSARCSGLGASTGDGFCGLGRCGQRYRGYGRWLIRFDNRHGQSFLKQRGLMIPPQRNAAEARRSPEPFHGPELAGYLVELLRRHMRFDCPHFGVAVASRRERRAAVIGQRDQRPETVRRQLVAVRQRLPHSCGPTGNVRVREHIDCSLPWHQHQRADAGKPFLRLVACQSGDTDQGIDHARWYLAVPIRMEARRSGVAAIVADADGDA